MSTLLGIDPSLSSTGYGLLLVDKKHIEMLECGVITGGKGTLGVRCLTLYDGLCSILSEYKPNVIAMEELHSGPNRQTAILMAHGRGVFLLAAAQYKIPVFSYQPSTVKRATTGSGQSKKDNVRKFVERMLSVDLKDEVYDVSDALAIALCHVAKNDIRRVA